MAETSARESAPFDAGRQRLGTVYAKSLLGVTEAAGNSSAVLEEFDSLVFEVFEKLPLLEARLAAPRVDVAEKHRLLEAAFGKRMSAELLTFLKVVARHGRLDCLREIRREAQRLFNTLRGRVEVQLRTAQPLEAATLAAITAKLRAALNREVVIHAAVEGELIGGLVVQVGDTVYDGSVANRLAQLRGQALEGTSQAMRVSLSKYVTAT